MSQAALRASFYYPNLHLYPEQVADLKALYMRD
jgi:hypothetical protein